MQGKERNNKRIDKQFTDRSWAEMQKILDAEMPQIAEEKGKRRYLLLLLILLIGFGSGVGTMVYFNQQQEINSPVPFKVNKKEIAETETINKKEAVSENITTTVLNESEKTQTQTKSITASQSNISAISNTNLEESFVKENTNSAKNLISFPPLAEKSQLIVDNSKSPNENHNYIEPSDVIKTPTRGFDFIITKTTELETPQMNEKFDLMEVPRSKKWSFGVILGNYSNTKRIAAGATIGGKATYNFDRRFTVGGGLQYSIMKGYKEGGGNRLERSADLAAALPEDFSFDSTATNTIQNEFDLTGNELSYSNNADLPISSLHYIEMPLEFTYRFSEKFQMNLGVKAGYMVNAKSDGNVYFYDNNSNQLQRQNDKSSFTNSLNKFDLATSVGLGFYPSKKFGIDLRYNHGLIDITKNEAWIQNQIDANRNIQLSVLYFFGNK